jgi:hypothetical protein
VYDPPMTFTILSGRWVSNTGYPSKLSMKDGHPGVDAGKTSPLHYQLMLQMLTHVAVHMFGHFSFL